MHAYGILALAILGEVMATTALKGAAGFSRLDPSVVVVAGYAAAFYFLSLVLDRIPIGTAYAAWSGSGIVLITLTAWMIYGQRPDAAGVIGMALIVTGVLVVNLWSNTAVH